MGINKIKKWKYGAFFYLKEDGTSSDAGLVEEMLAHENRIRQELIDYGVIREILVENKKPNNKLLIGGFMWIYLNNSFLSIVKPSDNNEPGILMVRARIRSDIEQVFPDAEIIHTPMRDYPFRAFIECKKVAEAMADQVLSIDYGNFKQSTTDIHRHDIYSRVWMATRSLHRSEPRDEE